MNSSVFMYKLLGNSHIFLFLFAIFACSENIQGEEFSIEFSKEELTFTYEQNSDTLLVSANDDWGVSYSEDWCTVSPSGGIAGEIWIVVKVAENEGDSIRTATLTFKSGSYRQKYTVTQKYLVEAVEFSDNAFAGYCEENFDTDSDGVVSVPEAAVVTAIDVEKLGIKSMDGLESFTSLELLSYRNNSIESLDISKQTALISLNCANNLLSELDIQLNINLEELDCTGNSNLTTIYVWTGFSPTSSFKKPDRAEYVKPEIPTPAGYSLVWHDEFETDISSDWIFETGNGSSGWGNNELEYYLEDNATVSDGVLEITAKKESYGGYSYTSARMKTMGNQYWTYGIIEARIKLPSFSGSWPAFWMLGENYSDVGWPSCGEIDIMEHINTESLIYGTIHWYADAYASYSGNTTVDDVTSYHVYSIEWDESSIKWYVDDVQYHEADIEDSVNGTDEFHKDFFILLNFAIGGDWPGFTIDENAFPATMYVDYVRVFQKNN